MNSPIKAVVFDWAWTLVDLGDEDDKKPFSEMFEFLRQKAQFATTCPGFTVSPSATVMVAP